MIVITAVTSHARISSAGEPTPRDISADTIKMPEPIMDPATMAVAENRPRPFTNCGPATAVGAGRISEVMIRSCTCTSVLL